MKSKSRFLLEVVFGGLVGLVLGVAILFGVALAVQTLAPLDTVPEFYLLGAPVGVVAGALAVFFRRRPRESQPAQD